MVCGLVGVAPTQQRLAIPWEPQHSSSNISSNNINRQSSNNDNNNDNTVALVVPSPCRMMRLPQLPPPWRVSTPSARAEDTWRWGDECCHRRHRNDRNRSRISHRNDRNRQPNRTQGRRSRSRSRHRNDRNPPRVAAAPKEGHGKKAAQALGFKGTHNIEQFRAVSDENAASSSTTKGTPPAPPWGSVTLALTSPVPPPDTTSAPQE